MTKSLNNHIVQQLLAPPNARTLAQEVNAVLEAERKRRLQFYKDITDKEKVEFINGKVVVQSPVVKEHNDATSLLHRLMSVFVDKK